LSGWQNLHLVLLAVVISGDEGETFAAGLRHQHPIERVAVDQRKASGSDGVSGINREFTEPDTAALSRHVQVRTASS
jgi:hypothetical protein